MDEGTFVDVEAGNGLSDAQVGRPQGAEALTAREVAVLAFERQWWKSAGAKDQAIAEAFDLSSTRYYQILNVLIDRPEAAQQEPQVVARLRRLRDSRRRRGSGLLPAGRVGELRSAM